MNTLEVLVGVGDTSNSTSIHLNANEELMPSTPGAASMNRINVRKDPNKEVVEDDELVVGVKRKLSSVVWNHFEKRVINGEEKAVRKKCKKALSGKSGYGTNHLHNHLNKSCYRSCRDIRQSFIASSTNKDGIHELGTYTFDPEVVRKDLACMIVLHEYPLSVDQYAGLKKFFFDLQPMFKMISRNNVRSDILKLYSTEKNKAMELMGSNQSRVAVTSDLWTCDICGTLTVANVLDPRFKMSTIKCYFPIIYKERTQLEIEKVYNTLTQLVIEYQTIGSSGFQHNPCHTFQSRSGTCGSRKYKFDDWCDENESDVVLKNDLELYLDEARLPRMEKFDILGWWSTNGVKFPVLQRIARDIYTIPMTTVASESAFSTSGRVVHPHRSRLLPTTVEALMCALSWIWAKITEPSKYNNGVAMMYWDDDDIFETSQRDQSVP